jgi:SAM-dependent methyltransferase
LNFKNTSNLFDRYAGVYDALYREKDYEGECDFLEEIFRRYSAGDLKHLLDMGCGSGGHAIPLARRGYQVFGIDRSPQMIAIARRKGQTPELSERLRFEVADAQNAELGETFDAVICMFAVLSYQTSNENLLATLRTVRKHLKPEGLFICDFWYGPAVLYQRPTERAKIINDGQDRIIRLVRPTIDTQTNTVTVLYYLFRLRNNQLIEEAEETHVMRFLFQPEIEFFMAHAGLRLVHFCPFLEFDRCASEATWNVTAIAQII